MSKKRPEFQSSKSSESSKYQKPPQSTNQPTPAVPWNPMLRGLISIAVALHLLAVAAAPWDLSTEPALPPGYVPSASANGRPQLPPIGDPVWQQPVVPRKLRQFFHHYLNLTYLNHGYQFFAPDPAGTHLIDYQVTQADGTVVRGRFPDLQEQWPRLLYHRHMMLAEQTELMGSESGQQYADFLARRHQGRCRLQWLIHLLLSPAEVKAGTPLTDPRTYRGLATVDSQISGEPRIEIPGGAL